MDYLFFCIRLLVSVFIAIFLYSLGVFVFSLLLFPLGYLHARINKILLYILGFILSVPILVFNLYFWGLWAAYCVSLTYSYSGREGVVYKWLYWITSFSACVSLIGWFEYKEKNMTDSESEIRSIGRGSLIYKLVIVICFFVFAFAPRFMDLPYGMILERLIPKTRQFTDINDDLNSNDLLNQGISKLNEGQYDDAIVLLNRVLINDKSSFEAYLARGSAKTFIGNHEGAIQDFDKAINLNPNLEQAYFLRGNSKTFLGESKQAIEDFGKSIEINTNFAEAYAGRGNAKLMMMDFEGAINDFDKAIELNFNVKEVYSGRGGAKQMLGDADGALHDCNKAIETDKNYAEAFACRGIAKISLGQTKDGCLDLAKSKEMGFSQVESFIDRLCH